MDGEDCKKCEFHRIGYRGKILCGLLHTFIEELRGFCPKEHTINEIKEKCDFYIPRLADGESCCLAHLAEGRALPCRIDKVEDLLRDPDFKLKKAQ
jgi:hypothetical protein